MGIVEGTKVEVVARAPLGGPVNIKALGYQLSLRKSEAEHILVQLA
jgi:ferrous iron transport protein A